MSRAVAGHHYPEGFLQSLGEESQAFFGGHKIAVRAALRGNRSLGRSRFWPIHLGTCKDHTHQRPPLGACTPPWPALTPGFCLAQAP